MTSFSRRLLIAAASALALAACGQSGSDSTGASGPLAEHQRADDIILGDPNAPVLIIEYASTTCPVCATFHTSVLPELKEKYIDTGLVKYAFRELPTAPEAIANAGFLLARCAPEERYYDVLDILFERQARITRSGQPRQELEAVAAAVGIDAAGFEACINDEAGLNRIAEVSEEGFRKYGAGSTPSFVIDGELYAGIRSLAFFDETLTPLLGDRAPNEAPAEEAEAE